MEGCLFLTCTSQNSEYWCSSGQLHPMCIALLSVHWKKLHRFGGLVLNHLPEEATVCPSSLRRSNVHVLGLLRPQLFLVNPAAAPKYPICSLFIHKHHSLLNT